ncbi:MAG: DUF3775 domain-containing protein [Gammaproteobacteria bacterium]|nr:DUF3775 domain-containing protein [Gammaproteobacteria bacterium]
MHSINKDIVANIIQKAREIDIEEDLTLPEDQENLSDAEWKQILAEYQDDMSYVELKNLINDLEPDQQQKIIALMYIGRGDFESNEWFAALEQARMIRIKSRADYLISKNMLANYLEEGLAKIGLSIDE